MSPTWTFIFGLVLLGIFAAYFMAEKENSKRILGTALTVLLCAFCINAFLPLSKKIHLGLDLQGGSSFLIRLVPPTDENGHPRAITPEMQEQAVEVIRKRVDQFGVSEPVISRQGSDRILVQIPGLDTAQIDAAREQLQRVAKLEFRLVHPNNNSLVQQIDAGTAITPPGYEILNGKASNGQPERYLVKKRPELTGDKVTGARAGFEQRGYEVSLTFSSEGGKIFQRVTAQNIGNQLAIVLDGEVISAPVIQTEISNGSAQITGNFTAQEAQSLASALQNPLQTPVAIDETRSVSATLGQDSIVRGLASGLAGLAATLVFVLIYYRAAGAVALIGLAVNGILLFGAMSLFGFVLTLPGIAGVILTIGMAIDANVLIYERLREELATGKTLKASIDTAYRKAFSAIFDANVTTLLKVVILFWLGSGPVKGFAITLTLGIIASMFSALLLTRNIFSWLIHLNLVKKISMLHLISSKHFDFLGKWKLSVVASIILLIVSGIAFGIRGVGMFNLDFTGGDSLILRSNQPITEAQVRNELEKVGLGGVVIQQETSQRNQQTVHLIAIRAPYGTGQKILNELKQSPATSGLVVENLDRVGPIMGYQLATTSLFALAIAFLGVMVYVAIRFEFSFSVGTIVAMFHDIIITLGIFVLTGRQFSLVTIGAILTVAGYSINDKIVVFDRIREGLHSGRPGTIRSLMNDSINETLSRTVLTSGVTLICMLALWIFGGPVLDDFAFTNVVGVIVGTYSSIFIAAPIVLWWTNLRKKNLRHEVARPRAQPAKA
ncbi:MAG: protein translocase subunit SecD [Verrucomicrobia bacterium]|nr:protein translocase subunit SecD [Verrucomicrobiota bacterium]